MIVPTAGKKQIDEDVQYHVNQQSRLEQSRTQQEDELSGRPRKIRSRSSKSTSLSRQATTLPRLTRASSGMFHS